MDTQKIRNKLIIDEKALETLGLHGKGFYVVEYDMYSEKAISPNQKKILTVEEKTRIENNNKLSREFRNKLTFALKFKLHATKHLESSWIIEGETLDNAVAEIEGLKNQMKSKGFLDCDERIKIIPIFTDNEGYQHYDDKKAEFILEFLMEHVKYTEMGIKEQRISQSTLWRCKQAVSICSVHSETLKDSERYNEILDTINILDELVARCEQFILEQKAANKKVD